MAVKLRALLLAQFILLFAVLFLVGCGGSGSSSGGTSRSVNVFVSDTFRDDYTQVWGTVFRIELLDAGGNSSTIFDDTTGKQFNFHELRDLTGPKFAFVNRATVSNVAYNRVRVTFGDTFTAIPPGVSAAAETFTVVGDAPATGGKVVVTRNLPSPLIFSSSDNFVLDVDLANFVVSGSNITPSLIVGDDTTLTNLNRHVGEDIKGTVSAISGTAPNINFDLQIANNRILRVRTDRTTRFFNESGNPSPALTNGGIVEVRGVFDVANSVLNATEVKIEDEAGNDDDEAKGVVTVENLTSFEIRPTRLFGFVPTETTIEVATTSNTLFLSDSGTTMTSTEFYAAIAVNSVVEAEGSYNPSTNVLTATKCKIDVDDDNGVEAEALGTVAAKNLANGTININVISYEGWPFPGGVLEITTTNDTVFMDDENTVITRQQFFNAISTGTRMDAKGSLVNGNKISGTRLRLKNET